MPDWMSPERVNLIRAFGAQIHPVSHEDGGFLGAIEMAEQLAAKTPGAFLPRQFANEDNSEAHETMTGPEIWWQLQAQHREPDAFVAGVGTGGTVMGVERFLRGRRSTVKVHPLEPSNSPTMSTGHQVGHHRIQGISDEFVPPIVHLEELDEIVAVDDGDAILMAQKLASELGLGVGISSGANLLGAFRLAEAMGPEATVVTLFPDSNKKYLSTDLLRNEPVKPDHWTPHVGASGLHQLQPCLPGPATARPRSHGWPRQGAPCRLLPRGGEGDVGGCGGRRGLAELPRRYSIACPGRLSAETRGCRRER